MNSWQQSATLWNGLNCLLQSQIDLYWKRAFQTLKWSKNKSSPWQIFLMQSKVSAHRSVSEEVTDDVSGFLEPHPVCAWRHSAYGLLVTREDEHIEYFVPAGISKCPIQEKRQAIEASSWKTPPPPPWWKLLRYKPNQPFLICGMQSNKHWAPLSICCAKSYTALTVQLREW